MWNLKANKKYKLTDMENRLVVVRGKRLGVREMDEPFFVCWLVCF